MTEHLCARVTWRKSTASDMADCVELGAAVGLAEEVLVRSSHEPDGTVLRLTREEVRAFLAGIRSGELDG